MTIPISGDRLDQTRYVNILRVNEIQKIIGKLQNKGWTLAALADELEITVNAVEKWKAGDRQPRNAKAVISLLSQILEIKLAPKKKRYKKAKNQ